MYVGGIVFRIHTSLVRKGPSFFVHTMKSSEFTTWMQRLIRIYSGGTFVIFCCQTWCVFVSAFGGSLGRLIASTDASLTKEMETLTTEAQSCQSTGLRGFRPGPTQTRLCSHRRWLGA